MFDKIWNRFTNREAVSYIVFGILTTGVDWLTYTILWSVGTDYRISTILSWCAAVLFAFVTNKIVVFRSRSIGLLHLCRELVSFVACRAVTGALTLLLMILMVDYLHQSEFLGKVVVSAISLLLNYIFSKLFVFRRKNHGEENNYGT